MWTETLEWIPSQRDIIEGRIANLELAKMTLEERNLSTDSIEEALHQLREELGNLDTIKRQAA